VHADFGRTPDRPKNLSNPGSISMVIHQWIDRIPVLIFGVWKSSGPISSSMTTSKPTSENSNFRAWSLVTGNLVICQSVSRPVRSEAGHLGSLGCRGRACRMASSVFRGLSIQARDAASRRSMHAINDCRWPLGSNDLERPGCRLLGGRGVSSLCFPSFAEVLRPPAPYSRPGRVNAMSPDGVKCGLRKVSPAVAALWDRPH
jgi:hypothetical protein